MTLYPSGAAPRLAAWALGLLTLAVAAQTPPAPAWERWLPAPLAAREALLQSPTAQMALSRRRALQARADAIAAGPAEFSVRASQQQRRVPLTQERFTETTVALERPLRAWGKAGLDAELAGQTRHLALIEQADGWHEASRALIQRWFDHWRALGDAQLSDTQLRLAQQLARQTEVRWRLGEVAQLDLALAQADAQRARAAHAHAQADVAQARATLTHAYPSLVLPDAWPSDAAAPPSERVWRDDEKADYLALHHELRLLRADAQRLQVAAERATRERWPDPSVGVFSSREREGSERITGIMLSLPLPGAARNALASAAHAEALAAQQRVQWAEQHWGAQFDRLRAGLQARTRAAQALSEAARTQADAAVKAAKAYALGEGSMADLIQIQRSAAEQARDAQRARLDAAEASALLELDLHRLWDWDDL